MKYTRFEELPVWETAIALAKDVYALTAAHRFRASLRDQLERAALSVSNNIAEGFERGTTQEVLTFLYIARGSAAEVRSMLCLLEMLPDADALKSRISNPAPKASPANYAPGPVRCRTRRYAGSVI